MPTLSSQSNRLAPVGTSAAERDAILGPSKSTPPWLQVTSLVSASLSLWVSDVHLVCVCVHLSCLPVHIHLSGTLARRGSHQAGVEVRWAAPRTPSPCSGPCPTFQLPPHPLHFSFRSGTAYNNPPPCLSSLGLRICSSLLQKCFVPSLPEDACSSFSKVPSLRNPSVGQEASLFALICVCSRQAC